MKHELKVDPEFMLDLLEGKKTFELRKDDRGFNVGDELFLREYNRKTELYSGIQVERTVLYVLRDAPHFGLMPGYCIMSLG